MTNTERVKDRKFKFYINHTIKYSNHDFFKTAYIYEDKVVKRQKNDRLSLSINNQKRKNMHSSKIFYFTCAFWI